ncbi:VOC family protein [Hymenobacter yonginensis]|uniref:VOC family protein n=1 Tax=Hymenobacter yonginensis TaxID=748197 RepID=A0ABY7PT97_9BACT|nr:VOC family protein [Hymenobacter yonginensis]WBO86140.1 VOC family protein [Hymenobacter yonginensis]
MEIDHLFIFSDSPHAVAEELRALGLIEGSSRVHPGQGTTNRKFYFENFFLEILWVHDEAEITSPLLQPTRLWERARYATTGTSPYGLCLRNTPDTDPVFTAALAYQPVYFPAGLPIEVLPHAHNPSLPWTFRLPFKGPQAATTEPTQHPAGLRRLTHAAFGLAKYEAADLLLQQLAGQPQLAFGPATANCLALTFDEHRQGQTVHVPVLNLTLAY